ncbi:MAG TPA: FtsX-like permease family protein [Chthoniobacteraceae bacterium]|jgi:putative ABC transport system permease protein|nr:FtsX-like permease family protein [Chthoniobacteraceae bacterium]
MKFLGLVWTNLKRKKLRTTLTLLSILVAFVLFALLSALKIALNAGVNMADANLLVARHRVSFIQLLPHSYMGRMAQIPGVSLVSHQTWFGGVYQDPKNQFATFPVEPEVYLTMNPEIVLREDEKQTWLKVRTGAVIGQTLATRLKWKVGDRVPLTSPIWPNKSGNAWQFDIVGIFDDAKSVRNRSCFLFRYDYFDEARERGQGQVGWYQVRVNDPKHAPEIAKAIDAEFANSSAETKTETEAAMFQGFAKQIGDIGTIVALIVAAVFFTILLVAGNTMAQSVRERTQELGVLKAVGFSSELVLGIVLGESLVITMLGGLAGLFLGWFMVSGMSKVSFMQQYFPLFFVSQSDLLLGVAFAAALGFVAGILPALQAMRLRTAEALRREG